MIFSRSLLVALVAIGLTGSVGAALAQTQPPTLVAQRPKLNLTESQKQQMKALKDDSRTQVRGVLTPDQAAQLDQAVNSGKKPKEVFASLNLSAQQQDQIKSIREATKEKIKGILTPEQLQQLEAAKKK